MKKVLSIILILILVFICGCTERPFLPNPTENTEGTSANTDQSFSTINNDDAVIDYHQEILSRMHKIPEYTAEPLLEFDANRQIYISIANQSCDFYPGYNFIGEMFWVITAEHYDPSEISVQISAKNKYDVFVADLSDQVNATQAAGGDGLYCLLKHQYFTMQGANWKKLADDTLYERIARELASNYERDSKHYNGFIRAIDEHTSGEWWDYETQFAQSTNDNLPEFFAYRVSVNFMELGEYEETIEVIDISVGETTYTVDIGQWRLHTKLPDEITHAIMPPGLEGDSITVAYTKPPNADGYAVLSDATVFLAKEDITLLGFRQMDTPVGEFPIIGARVKYVEDVDGEWVTVMDYYWDTKRPLNIEKGTRVFIDLYLKDERFSQYEFCYTVNLFMQYELRGKTYEKVTSHNLNCIHDNVWDTYLMAFEGVDTGEYYASYRIPLDWTWLYEVPNEWLQ